jgi:hypothetical protein
MKVNVVEALAHDKSVLATPHAVEGLPAGHTHACTPWRPTLLPENFAASPRPRRSPEIDEALSLFSSRSFPEATRDLMGHADEPA